MRRHPQWVLTASAVLFLTPVLLLAACKDDQSGDSVQPPDVVVATTPTLGGDILPTEGLPPPAPKQTPAPADKLIVPEPTFEPTPSPTEDSTGPTDSPSPETSPETSPEASQGE